MKKLRRQLFFFVVLASILLFSGSLIAENLRIYCIDVDQGMSTLIVTPNGKSILIDCGDRGKQDAVYKVITNEAGLSSVDYFVCTHYHLDHYGCIKKLFEKGLTVNEKFYDRDSEYYLPADKKKEGSYYDQYADIANNNNREYLRPGAKIDIDDTVEIECIVANGRAKGIYGEIDYPNDENGYSLGLIISYNDFDFFIAGDLNEEVEPELAQLGILKDVDVYHVSHHGSETSSHLDLLNVIKPEVCVISNGSHGGHKHPRKNTIERLDGISSVVDIYQTNKNVKASQYPDKVKNVPDTCIGDLDCDGDDGTILIEVNSNTYKLTLINRNIEKTYNIEK